MTSEQGHDTSSDHERNFLSCMIIYLNFTKLPKTKICVDMTLTSYLITDSYLGHEQSLYQMLKLVLLFPKVIFFNQLETEVIWTDCNDESCDYHYKLNCLWNIISLTSELFLNFTRYIYCPIIYGVF